MVGRDILVLFDWGGTLMVDSGLPGPVADWPEVAEVAGASQVLAELSARCWLALATNAAQSDEVDIRRALARVGLDGYIEAIYCARGLGLEKPDPAFFTAVLRDQGVGPERAVMVGDSFEGDIRGALAAGLKAVWLAPGRRHAEAEAPDLVVIESLGELPGALSRFNL